MALIDLKERDVDKWTLRVVVERGALAFECRKCWHLAQLDLLELVARFGPEMLVRERARKNRVSDVWRAARAVARSPESRPEGFDLGTGASARGESDFLNTGYG